MKKVMFQSLVIALAITQCTLGILSAIWLINEGLVWESGIIIIGVHVISTVFILRVIGKDLKEKDEK